MYNLFILFGRELFTLVLLILLPIYIVRRLYRRLRNTISTVDVDTVSYTLDDGASAPVRASAWAAGYDMKANRKVTIAPGKCALVGTGVHMAIPKHMYGRLAPRSSLAYKHRIFVNAGVIDADYTGELKLLLHNAGDEEFTCNIGDRVGQLLFELKGDPTLNLVSELEATQRGTGGFGSTGRR